MAAGLAVAACSARFLAFDRATGTVEQGRRLGGEGDRLVKPPTGSTSSP